MKFENIVRHFLTISYHRYQVMKLCFRCGLYYQGLIHDLSKYSPTEFFNGARYYLGYRSPIGNERRQTGRSLAFLHHKGYNRHHLEYWFDPYASGRRISMPDKYILESICDRIAAAKIYLKDKYTIASPLEYFLNDHPITDFILQEEYDKFYYLLAYLRDNGEKELIKLIREIRSRGYIIKNDAV